jgi:hypothetical protein
MNLTTWVDVAIGLIVVYLGTSLFVTIVNEHVARAINSRGRQLMESLKDLIDHPETRDALRNAPALAPFFPKPPAGAPAASGLLAFFRKNWDPPSYVDPAVLGRLLVGSLSAAGVAGNPLASLGDSVGKMAGSSLGSQLQALLRTSDQSMEKLIAAVSEWADRSLNALGERYKRSLQKISLVVGFCVAAALNIDTVALTRHLYQDKEAREAAAAVGVQLAGATDKAAFDECMKDAGNLSEKPKCKELSGLVAAVQGRNATLGRLPIGWPALPHPAYGMRWMNGCFGGALLRLLGWLLTALAVSLGAPFWFDLLNKFVNVRQGMKRPELAPKEG